MKTRFFGLLWVALSLAGCAVGPDYKAPVMPLPEQFKESAALWQPVKVGSVDVRDSKTDWWSPYQDSQLSALLEKVAGANLSVAQVAAQYRQAEALLAGSRASWWPTLSGTVSSSRGAGVSGSTITTGSPVKVTDKLSATASWELDLWGRISRGVESNQAALEASEADLQAALLSAQVTLAQSYWQWQANQGQQKLLQDSVKAQARILEITEARRDGGIATAGDVAQAEAQLNSTRAQALDLEIQQAQLSHAIAVLQGQLPGATATLRVESLPELPRIPTVLPSRLVQARPDIVAAERRVAAANAQIGVAQAAYFPSLTLGGTGGYQDSTFKNIVSAPNRFWSVGPTLALTLFDGGARTATRRQAEAVHEQRAAAYRQVVLTAFQEVEDQLATLRVLAQEQDAQLRATDAARQSFQLAEHQYAAGTVSLLNVLTAQTTALNAERTLRDVQLRQLLASVALVKAVGGVWD